MLTLRQVGRSFGTVAWRGKWSRCGPSVLRLKNRQPIAVTCAATPNLCYSLRNQGTSCILSEREYLSGLGEPFWDDG